MARRHGANIALPPSLVQRSLGRLRDRELVERVASGGYRVADVLLRRWLRRMQLASDW
jgi:hypothetical protein